MREVVGNRSTMTDREALLSMLHRAEAAMPRPAGDSWNQEWLYVQEGQRSVRFSTGPDDATATFTFGEDGMLAAVSVDESSSGEVE